MWGGEGGGGVWVGDIWGGSGKGDVGSICFITIEGIVADTRCEL